MDPSILKTERPPVTCARSKSYCGRRNRPTAPPAPPAEAGSFFDPSETWAAQDFRTAKVLFVPSLSMVSSTLTPNEHDLPAGGSHGNPRPTARIHCRALRGGPRLAARRV